MLNTEKKRMHLVVLMLNYLVRQEIMTLHIHKATVPKLIICLKLKDILSIIFLSLIFFILYFLLIFFI